MQVDLSGRVAIVTGAGRGIGKELAARCAAANASVVLAARSETELREAADEIQGMGRKALAVPTDVSDPSAVHQMVSRAIKEFGQIDLLVNNAAVNYVSSLVRSDDSRWRSTIEVNVLGVYYCTKAVLRHMIRAKQGRIINIASIAGKTGAAFNSAYSTSKAAVLGFTKAVALEVAKLGITVNAICPWHVETPMVLEAMGARGAMFGQSAEDYLAKIVKGNPQQRIMTASEVASLALFLASPEAAGINGQAINLCGGVLTAG